MAQVQYNEGVPAGYLGDLLRAAVPKRAQDYIAGGEGRGQ